MSNSHIASIPLNDIEKIELYINSNRKTLDQIKKETGADYLLNGTLYDMSNWAICCHAKADGKVLFKPNYNLYGYAWNDGSDISLELIPDSKDDNYISCVCLVRNSKIETMYYDSALGGKRGRSVIGTKDGELFLFCCKDGTSDAKTPENLQKYCIELGLKDAVMLDGGGSSQCDFDGNKITSTRRVQNLILVYLKNAQTIDSEGETIMSNSKLATYTRLSPNKTSPRNHKIDTISPHVVVGQFTAKEILDMSNFTTYNVKTGASCNYAIGKDGSIGLGVDESDRSWCTSSSSNDHRAITIEIASEKDDPYEITDKAYDALIDLCADICKRNDIKELKWCADKSLIGQVDKQNITVHRWFANKACPGDYVYNRLGQIADEVNAKLGKNTNYKKYDKAYSSSSVTTKTEGVCNVELKVLKKGSKGDAVKSLQILLIGYGYSCGSSGIDGSFGSDTDKAVRSYQKIKGLTVDGCVGPATWAKLLGTK